jgi:hypothetical protein
MSADGKTPDPSEAKWLLEMASLEEDAGGFPATTGRLVRLHALDRIPSEFKDWAALEAAIRPQVPKKFVAEVRSAISANLLTAAIQMMWNAVLDDLRRKVVAFGLQHFAALEGMPPLRDAGQLEELLTPYQLLAGCHTLQLLDKEAYVQLLHCGQLVRGYAQSADFQSQIDRLDVLNFIKNCVKYCLAVDGPQPGIDIKSVIAAVDSGVLDANGLNVLTAALQQQPGTASTLIRLLFRRYVEEDAQSGGTRDASILQVFPIAWAAAEESAKQAIANEFVRIRLSQHSELDASRAWQLLVFVDGARYLDDVVLEKYVEQGSTALLAAHNGFGNFAAEGSPARNLLSLGSRIPAASRDLYLRAVLECYLGNPYGVSTAALPSLEKMVDRFDASLATRAVQLLVVDPELRSTLMSTEPARRLKGLLQRIRSRIQIQEVARLADELIALSTADVAERFRRG